MRKASFVCALVSFAILFSVAPPLHAADTEDIGYPPICGLQEIGCQAVCGFIIVQPERWACWDQCEAQYEACMSKNYPDQYKPPA
jgi:hypothetical protein